jgi:hypothetical protein
MWHPLYHPLNIKAQVEVVSRLRKETDQFRSFGVEFYL